MEIGLYTFGDLPVGTSGPEASKRRLLEVVKAAKLADQRASASSVSENITGRTIRSPYRSA